MSTSKSNLRSSCSFPNLLLACLNFFLFVLSAASLVLTVLLRMPPSSLGLAFLMISGISLFSSFIGFYSHLCFITHVALLLASLFAQILSVLALFTKERSSLSMFKSPRDPREAKLLVRLECGVLMAMLMMQTVVLMLSCWVREYEGLEAEREETTKKMSWRVAKVQEESRANAEKIIEIKAKEFDEKIKNKYGGSKVKPDNEVE